MYWIVKTVKGSNIIIIGNDISYFDPAKFFGSEKIKAVAPIGTLEDTNRWTALIAAAGAARSYIDNIRVTRIKS